jgi:hypothetical protein
VQSPSAIRKAVALAISSGVAKRPRRVFETLKRA